MYIPAHLNREEALHAFHIAYLRQLMIRCNGNIVKMSHHAGMNREAITRQIKRFGLQADLQQARTRTLHLYQVS